jgi:hypothetical protein
MVVLASVSIRCVKAEMSSSLTGDPLPRETPMESTNTSDLQDLKALIKESLREVLKEERFNLCQILMPYVSDQEQADIDAGLGAPEAYDPGEFIDLTDWVKHGGSIQ